jgi:Asp-tRNA(Asn)/Glu-tRNA(Gln) amidotransferase A subunit family amidase
MVAISFTSVNFPSHQNDSATAQSRRQAKINAVKACLEGFNTVHEEQVHSLSLSELVESYQTGVISSHDVLVAYGKKAITAHNSTNCLTDVMINGLLAGSALTNSDTYTENSDDSKACVRSGDNPSGWRGTLGGVPVSIKDCIDVEGCPTTLGYSSRALEPATSSAAIVDLLRDAGALIHAKTTVPTGLFSVETTSALFGCTTNPVNPAYSSGASTGGGGALVASGGSMIEVGTDVAGSVRVPAAFCGIYALKASSGRFPMSGVHSSAAGFEAIPTVCSPLARRLDDLAAFFERVISMRPWEYDRNVRISSHSVSTAIAPLKYF